MLIASVDALRELARRAQEELAKRRHRPDFKENVIAQLRADLFPEQLAVMDDPSPRIAMCCSRRAGKTEVAGRMIAIELLKAGHNHHVLFAARTLARARQIIWPILEKINDEYSLGWTMSQHIGQIVTEDGGIFSLLGVDDANAAEKVRGSKYRLAVCDESATYENLLERLVIDCLEPGTLDFSPRGRIVLAGTPGYSRAGYWYAVSTGGKKGWSSHYWTLVNNPHIKNVEEELRSLRESNGWTEEEPTYRREYVGEWVADESTLVYAALERRNTCKELPAAPGGMALEAWIREAWLVTVALDVGYTDEAAVVAIGSPPHSQDIYVLDCFVKAGLRADEQAALLKEFRDKYKPVRTVIDAGGQGKLVHGEFNQRYAKTAGGIAIAAKKQGKVEAIGMMNTDLRAGKMKAYLPAAVDVMNEWTQLPWADDDKTKIHPAYKNHASDATLYAWREHKAFLTKPAPREQTEADREEARAKARNDAARKRLGVVR